MNVCLLNDSFPPIIDGVSNTVVNYAGIIQNKYGSVVVATPKYPDAADDYAFEVLRYPSVDTTKLLGYRTGYPFSLSTLMELGEKPIDIIHAHCPMMSTLMARTLRTYVGSPVILTYHTKFDIDIKKALESHILQQAAINMLVQNISACDEVWAVSRGAGEDLKSIGYEGEYIVMENGVDFPKGRVPEIRAAEVRKAVDAERVPLLLFVGRLMWYKGIDLILDALSILKENGRDFRMVFVGDGADRKEIEAYAESLGLGKHCRFAGVVIDRETLRAHYCASDLLVFPSTFDTNGLVVREAAACSLPAILINGSAAAEGIIDGHNGFTVDEDPCALASAIEVVWLNPQKPREVGEKAAEDLYISWEDSVGKAVARYETVQENFKMKSVKRRQEPGNVPFMLLAELCEGITKAKKLTEKLKRDHRQAINK